jgi:hypothetical protein
MSSDFFRSFNSMSNLTVVGKSDRCKVPHTPGPNYKGMFLSCALLGDMGQAATTHMDMALLRLCLHMPRL